MYLFQHFVPFLRKLMSCCFLQLHLGKLKKAQNKSFLALINFLSFPWHIFRCYGNNVVCPKFSLTIIVYICICQYLYNKFSFDKLFIVFFINVHIERKMGCQDFFPEYPDNPLLYWPHQPLPVEFISSCLAKPFPQWLNSHSRNCFCYSFPLIIYSFTPHPGIFEMFLHAFTHLPWFDVVSENLYSQKFPCFCFMLSLHDIFYTYPLYKCSRHIFFRPLSLLAK